MTPRPVDNLVRAWASPEATGLRASANGDGNTMFGHFAVFNRWTEINSWFEGQFLERIAPGAFASTFAERGDRIRVLYDHGADPMIGNKPLGSPDVLREDRTGAYYEVGLFDSSYVNDLKPAIRSGQLGASFRFKVTGEEWNTPSEPTRDNPQMLEERTITAVDLYEFGPVTFPAYADASAALRSRTDEFIEHFLNDPQFVARFKERAGPAVVTQITASIPADRAKLGQQVVDAINTYTAAHGDNWRSQDPDPPTADENTPETPTAPTEPEEEPPTETSAVTDETADGGEAEARARRIAWTQRRTAGFVEHLARLKETGT